MILYSIQPCPVIYFSKFSIGLSPRNMVSFCLSISITIIIINKYICLPLTNFTSMLSSLTIETVDERCPSMIARWQWLYLPHVIAYHILDRSCTSRMQRDICYVSHDVLSNLLRGGAPQVAYNAYSVSTWSYSVRSVLYSGLSGPYTVLIGI